MSHTEPGPLASYNSLQDKHLAGYFANTRMKRHLKKSGLITKEGRIVNENSYRLKMAKKEHQKHVRDLLATAIVHKALDMERMRQYEIRKKLDELYKVELVQRVKSGRSRKGDEDIMPLLSPRSRSSRPHSSPASLKSRRRVSDVSSAREEEDTERTQLPDIRYDETKKRLHYKDGTRSVTANAGGAVADVDESPYRRPHTWPHPPPPARKKKKSKMHRGLILARTETTVAHRIQLQSMAEVSMKFLGPNINLTSEMFPREKVHEVMVLQQHCGGSTLCVFRELLPPNTIFSFVSRRHRGSPFGLTIYIDSIQNSRLSCCCEYKHKPGYKLGGKNGRFTFVGVTGAAPCYKCQVAFAVARENERDTMPPDQGQPAANEEEYVPESETEEVGQGFDIIVSTTPKTNEEEKVPDTSRTTVAVQTDDIQPPKIVEPEPEPEPEPDHTKPEKEEDENENKSEEPINYDKETFENADEGDTESDKESVVSSISSKHSSSDSEDESSENEYESEKENESDKEEDNSEIDEIHSDKGNESNKEKDNSDIEEVHSDKGSASDKEKDSSDVEEVHSDKKFESDSHAKLNHGDNDDRNVDSNELDKKEDNDDEDAYADEEFEMEDTAHATAVNEPEKLEQEVLRDGASSRASAQKDVVVSEEENDNGVLEGKEDEEEIRNERDMEKKSDVSDDDRGIDRKSDVSDDERNVDNHDDEVQQENSHKDSDNGNIDKDDQKVNDEALEQEPEEPKKEEETPVAEGDNSEVSDNSLEVSPAKDMSISSADDGAVGGRGLKDDSVPSEGNEEVSQKQNDVGDSNEAPTDKPEGVAEAKEEAEEVNTEESKTEKEEGQEPEDIREPQEVINHHDDVVLSDNSEYDRDLDQGHVADDEPQRDIDLDPGDTHEGSVAPLISNTKDMELTSVSLSPEQMDEVSKLVVENNNSIDSLSLRNASIDDEGVAKIKEAVKNADNLKMLNLTGNNIGPDGAKHLGEVLKESKNIRIVMLHGNPLGNEGVEHVTHALKESKSVTTLDLGDCQIGNTGARSIAEMLLENESITDINMSGNVITAEGWKSISDSLKINCSLTTLSLDFNNLGDEGITILSEGISENSALRSIDLEGNKIGNTGAEKLLEAVRTNKNIVDVTLMPLNNINRELQDTIKAELRGRIG